MLYKITNRLSAILTDITYILSPEYKVPKRSKLLLDYLRLRLKVFLNQWFKFKKEHFLNYEVKFINYSLFFEIFRQVFIRQSYYTIANSDEPLTIIDCGGNIGMSVLYFKYMFPNSKVEVFEPSLAVLPTIKYNIEKNSLQNIKLYPYAVSDTDGELTIFDRGIGACGNTLIKSVFDLEKNDPKTSKDKQHQIKSQRLSNFITQPVDILKLDIEGSEGSVIEDLKTTSKLTKIKNIVLEYHSNPHLATNDLALLLKSLSDNNHYYQFFTDEVIPSLSQPVSFNEVNYILIRTKLNQ